MTSPAVVGEGVELRYGDRVALAASDFFIPAGRVTVLIGPNGSGKSTLLAAVAGLHQPNRGRLEVLGTSPSGARRRVALVLQSTKVNEALPVTVREVVMMGRYASLGMLRPRRPQDRAAVDKALRRLGLEEVAGHHLAELSGGMRQRVFVAQGLAQDHDLLLMDEPLTALDLVSTGVISEVVEEEKRRGVTVVVSSHDLGEAAAADHVLLLAGEVAAAGPPGEVLTPANLSAAYRSQIVEVGGGVLIDDAAHNPADLPHLHVDRPAGTHHHDPPGR